MSVCARITCALSVLQRSLQPEIHLILLVVEEQMIFD
jgi:hypothetical protein